MKLILNLLISGIGVFIAAYILPGVHVDSFVTALIVAVVLGAANAFIKPVLTFITLPITILTLGLFTFVISALLVLLTDFLIAGFSVDNFLWAILFSLVLSIINAFLNTLKRS